MDHHTEPLSPAAAADRAATISPEVLRSEIAGWLKRYLAQALHLDAEPADERMAFDRYGLDSAAAIAMSSDLGDWLGAEVGAEAAYDHPSIAQLAEALANDPAVQAAFLQRHAQIHP